MKTLEKIKAALDGDGNLKPGHYSIGYQSPRDTSVKWCLTIWVKSPHECLTIQTSNKGELRGVHDGYPPFVLANYEDGWVYHFEETTENTFQIRLREWRKKWNL